MAKSVWQLATGWTSGDRIPVRARFSAPVQTNTGAHPASYTRGTGSYSGLNWPGCGIDHPLPSRALVRKRVELFLCSTPAPSGHVWGWTLSIVKLPLNNQSPTSLCNNLFLCVLMLIIPISSCPFHTNYSTQHLTQQIPGAFSLVVKWPGCQADYSPPSSIEVKHEWDCTSTPPICHQNVHRGKIFLFNFPNLPMLNLLHVYAI
jgi:hypothetical protein